MLTHDDKLTAVIRGLGEAMCGVIQADVMGSNAAVSPSQTPHASETGARVWTTTMH